MLEKDRMMDIYGQKPIFILKIEPYIGQPVPQRSSYNHHQHPIKMMFIAPVSVRWTYGRKHAHKSQASAH